MKEFKYKDVKGFEEKSLPRQLDTFEAPGSKTLKDRYIFDFSRDLDYSENAFSTERTVYFFPNLTRNGESWDYYAGNPGNANVMYDSLPLWDYPLGGEVAADRNSYLRSVVPDISGELEVPYFNEDGLIYIDEPKTFTYGNTSGPNFMKTFRSGYIEFTLKTDKSNSIIGMGSTKYTSYYGGEGTSHKSTGGSEAERAYDNSLIGSSTVIDSSNAYLNEDGTNVDSLYLNLKNGKIELDYKKEYGVGAKAFKIIGNKNIADNQWHHVVINFGKPGTINHTNKKDNKRFIEIWIDGVLDKVDYEYINKTQVFFPVVEWLLMDPILIQEEDADSFWLTENVYSSVNSNMTKRDFSKSKSIAFRGSFGNFASGMNYSLSSAEIKQRNRLYKGYTKKSIKSITANAEMVSPIVSANKPKALKLYWNNLYDNSKHGLELDDNFIVHSYSVTHKAGNSPTEIFNIDLAPEREIKYLTDVRIALKDNVFIFGPGKEALLTKPEVWNAQVGEQQQLDGSFINNYDALNSVGTDFSVNVQTRFTTSAIANLTFSGVSLKNNDRILLTNQFNPADNGIYIYNGVSKILERADDADSAHKINNAVVRVTDGYYKDTSFILSNKISSMMDAQLWSELEFHPDSENLAAQPLFTSRWSNLDGTERFIDLQQDVNINDYSVIVFMNYPETDVEVNQSFINYEELETRKKYENFIKSIKDVAANGASIYISSPKLAEDLGAVRRFTKITQEVEASDAQSALTSPFEVSEPADRYFDTHRQNAYHLDAEIAGLTNKETYILTDFINYIPDNSYDYEQYHAKYSYRQLGLKEGNEFIIPGTSLRKITNSDKLPGFNLNQSRSNDIFVVAPNDVLAGTVVTSLANNHYHGSTLVVNEYDDYATTIIIHNNQLLGSQPISGKIFINCVEDSYTFSREEYNKATIQVIPQNEISENTATRAWQYSTTRLNRIPQKINLKEMTKYGQTTPTNGGGGAFIQSQTNSSNGIIRSATDKNNINHQSDLYSRIEEEIYPIQEIPVLSMTWLGLQWLAE
jgi:hypothetical protein